MKEKPKCPKCGTNKYVVLDNTGKKVSMSVGVGAVAGYSGAAGGAAGLSVRLFLSSVRYRCCHR